MPVYEYKCATCGAEFTFLRIKASDEPVCPECKSRQVTKKISSFSCSGGGIFSGGFTSSGSGGC
ncbi:MAG: zinc ribbon domain-containing protein [Nitrospiraceae bacterium]|nr:zinc ribbon domain-containing protein [Nitrospiraceae bacterium]